MDDLDDVLARARSAYGPDPEAKERVRGALSAAVGGAALAGAGTAKAAAAKATAAKATAAKGAATLGTKVASSGLGTAVGWGTAVSWGTAVNLGMVAKLGVVAALAGGSVLAYGAFEHRRTEHAAPATDDVAVVAPRVEAHGAAALPGTDVPEVTPPAPTPEVAETAEPIAPMAHGANALPRAKGAEETSPLAPRSTIRDELQLIRRATEELRAGQPREALATLAVHRNRFPTSAMTTEREGLGLLARCSLGRNAETRAAAERFARDAGSSPLAAHVGKQCLK